nr:hypothetical protein [Tanacetum cinerariifolium]
LGDSQSLLIVDGIHVQVVKIDDDLKAMLCLSTRVSLVNIREQDHRVGKYASHMRQRLRNGPF